MRENRRGSGIRLVTNFLGYCKGFGKSPVFLAFAVEMLAALQSKA